MLDAELRLRSRYALLRIPVISWVALVFPLVLPPIPLGPIAVSLAWDRFEQVELVRRARRFAGCTRRPQSFPFGWITNLFVNAVDLATLGLRSAFMAAWLADRVNRRAVELGGDAAPTSNMAWLLKWLLLGNVVFLAAWIIFPGYVLLRFVESMERALYRAYRTDPWKIEAQGDGLPPTTIVAEPALSSERLLAASRNHLAVLGIYMRPLAPSEIAETEGLAAAVSDQVHASSELILRNNVAVFWCNLSRNYPTHYVYMDDLLPASAKTDGKWVAFQDGQMVCSANCASEAIAKSLGIAATVRSVANMVVGTVVSDLNRLVNISRERPVIAFICRTAYGPSDWVKFSSPAFLEALSVREACITYLMPKKQEDLKEELREHDLGRGIDCVIWYKGQAAERIKSGWTGSGTDVITKATAWLLGESDPAVTSANKNTEHRYQSLPCYVFARWGQVVQASASRPLVLATGSQMDVQKAEAAFLRRVGGVFADRGFDLAVAQEDPECGEDAVGHTLLSAGLKPDGCYVVKAGRVVSTIAKTPPQGPEDGWLKDAVQYLCEM